MFGSTWQLTENALGDVGNASGLDHPGALEPDVRAREVVEQPDAIPEQDRDLGMSGHGHPLITGIDSPNCILKRR